MASFENPMQATAVLGQQFNPTTPQQVAAITNAASYVPINSNVGTSVKADMLGTTPLNIAPPTTPIVPNIANLPGGTATPTATTPTAPPPGQTNTITDKLSGLVAKFTGKAQEQQTAEQAATSPLENQRTQIAAQIKRLQADSVAQQDAAVGRVGGTPTANSYDAQQSARTSAIQGLLLQSQYDSLGGDIASAKANADQAIEVKYSQMQQDIQSARDNIYNNWDSFSGSEKKRASAALAQLDANDQYAKQNIQDEKDIQGMIATALAQNPNDPNVALAAKKASDSGDIMQAISLLGKYQTDQVKAELDRKVQKAQLQKLINESSAAVAADAAVNPDVLQGMLAVYQSTGVLPAFGQSAKSPLRAQFYAALGKDPNIVGDAGTNKAVRAGLTTALRTQQNQYSANQTAISTLDKQLDLAKSYSDKVGRSSSPLVNKYLLATKSGVFGDPETAALNNIVTTASYEMAKILSGSAASIAGATVSSAADAKDLLNGAMARGQFNEVLGLMKQEADFRLKSQGDTITSIQKDLNNVGNLTQNLPPTIAPPKEGDTHTEGGVTWKLTNGVWTPTK